MSGPIDAAIIAAASAGTRLPAGTLSRVIHHIAYAGFAPTLERARGRLAGVVWQGRTLKGSDYLSPAEVHCLRHVAVGREWPDGTAPQGYIDSIRGVVLAPSSGVLTSRYQGAWQVTIVGKSNHLKGPLGYDHVFVEYRCSLGYWITAYQPRDGLNELSLPVRSDLLWHRPLM